MKAEFPEKLACLFDKKARFIVLYGGRGGAKSWGAARSLLLRGVVEPLRILCARETQRSITDSVHKLLSDQIVELGLEGHYTVQQQTIIGKNGTEFIFAGLRQNITNLKSYENVNICWIEEAQVVSKHSWEILLPTIRAKNSQFVLTFNPELDTDDTYQRFIVNPPPRSIVQKVNYSDNPWFPEELEELRMHCRATESLDTYNNIWEGMCRQSVEGAIYAVELSKCELEGRITKVPYDASFPVQTFWDLGDRYTSIWFCQARPFQHCIIDYMEGEAYSLSDYLAALQGSDKVDGRKRQYVYSNHVLPWDAKSPQLGTGRSIEEQMRSAGFSVRVMPKLTLTSGINYARTIFPQCWFDGDKCYQGLQGLRHYRWAPDSKDGVVKKEPLHDWASHPADAFRNLAVSIKFPQAHKPKREKNKLKYGAWS